MPAEIERGPRYPLSDKAFDVVYQSWLMNMPGFHITEEDASKLRRILNDRIRNITDPTQEVGEQ